VKRNWLLKILLLLGALIVVAAASVFIGPVRQWDRTILLEIRLPRVLLGLMVGAGLAVAGTIYQGLLRNPLADPHILGISSGAALGVMVSNVLGFHHYGLYVFAIIFAILAIAIVYLIAQVNGRTPVQTLILAGVIVSTFFSALFLLGFSLLYQESFSVLFFLMGTLTEGNRLLLRTSAILIGVGVLVCLLLARDLNVMTQGEEAAAHLGLDTELIKKILFGASSAIVAASVAISGMIGFIGLMIPHIMRRLVGADHRILIPASALAGASFLILVDTLARTVAAPIEVPVGVITALCGAPFFIYLLKTRRGGTF
jgi:iron complex transport system permease protein